MLSQSERVAILELSAKKVGTREIARTMKISRWAVRKVIRSNSAAVTGTRIGARIVKTALPGAIA